MVLATRALSKIGRDIEDRLRFDAQHDPDASDIVSRHAAYCCELIQSIAVRQDGWAWIVSAIRHGLFRSLFRVGLPLGIGDKNLYADTLYILYKRRASLLVSREMMRARRIGGSNIGGLPWRFFEHLFFRYNTLKMIRDAREDELYLCCTNVSACLVRKRRRFPSQPACGLSGHRRLLKMCARCKSVFFCSASCLESAWTFHKSSCKKIRTEGGKSPLVLFRIGLPH